MKIIEKLLTKRKVIFFLCIFLVVAGVYSYSNIPKQKMPDTTPPIGTYQLIAPGYSSEEMYELIVNPIEQVLLYNDDIRSINASTYDGFAIIMVVLDVRERNVDDIWEKVNKDVNAVKLPDEAMDPIFKSDFGFPHAVYSVTADEKEKSELESAVQAFTNSIQKIPEIQSVEIDGNEIEVIQVQVNMEKLNELPLTMKNIGDLIHSNGMNIPLGSIQEKQKKISIEGSLKYDSIEELENLIIFRNPQTTEDIHLIDIAEIEKVTKENSVRLYANGKEAFFVSIYFKDNLDFTKLGDELNEVVKSYNEDYPELNVEQLVFQPEYVDEAMNQVNMNLLQGIILVLIIVLIGLGLRNAFSIAITFPIIVFSTILSLFVLGESIQMITITGLIITIGIIVDNSIVISEAIQYRLDLGETRNRSIYLAVKENALPVLSSTLTTIAAFSVLMFLPDVAGKMIVSLPLTVIIAITISYIAAMFVTPVIASVLYKKRTKYKTKKVSEKSSKWLRKIVGNVLNRPIMVLVLSIVLFLGIVGVGMAGRNIVLFPSAQESIVYVTYDYTSSNKEIGVEKFSELLVEEILNFDNIEYMAHSVGGDLPRFDTSVSMISPLPTSGRIYIRFDEPYSNIPKIIGKMEEQLAKYLTYGSIQISELLVGPDIGDVSIFLSSENIDRVVEVAHRLESYIQSIKSIKSYGISYPLYQDKYQLSFNRNALAEDALIGADVQMQIRSMIFEETVGKVQVGENHLSIHLGANIENIEQLENSGIFSQKFMQKNPLNNYAEVTKESYLKVINTVDGEYQLIIDIRAEDTLEIGSIMQELQNEIDNMDTSEVVVDLGGMNAEAADSMSDVGIAGIVAIIIIYIIMLFQFNSFWQPLIVLITIPLSFIGSFLVLILFNVDLTFTVMIGLVSLTGIVVNTGILLIDYINKARALGKEIRQACIESVERRIRPIILSSITTIFGLIPLVIYGGAFFGPLAYTLIGGLAASTFLTIFIIPALYYLVERRKDRNTKSDKC